MKVMAFDFGLNRIGVATGHTDVKIAHPLANITGKNKFEKLDKITLLVNKWQPELLLVGMPSFGDDKIQLIASIEKFARRLEHRFKLPLKFINEDYSSSDAASLLNDQQIYGRSQVGFLDQLSACAILSTYFNSL